MVDNKLLLAFMILLLAFLIWGLPSLKWHFKDYQPGIAELAEVVRNMTEPDERIFFTTNPTILWHADRKGYFGPYGLSELKFGEENRSIRTLVMYLCDTEMTQRLEGEWSDMWDYIRANYELIYNGTDCKSTVWRRIE